MTDKIKDADDAAAKAKVVAKAEAVETQEKSEADAAKNAADALKQQAAKPIAGSPVTAGSSGEADPGKGGTLATEGNESKTVVAPQTSDNSPDTPPGDHANISAPTQDAKNPNVVKPEDVAGKTEEIANQRDLDTKSPERAGNFDYVDNTPETVVTEEMLDAIDERENPAKEALHTIRDIVAVTNSDTPDSFIVWGYGGKKITLGDLRAIAKVVPDRDDE